MHFLVRASFVLLSSIFLFNSCVSTNEAIVQTADSPLVTVNGKITDDSTGEPVSNVEVWFKGTSFNTTTNSTGQFRFKAPKGYYQLYAAKGGYYEYNETVKVGEFNSRVGTVDVQPIRMYRDDSYSSRSSSASGSFSKETRERLNMLKTKVDSLQQLIAEIEHSGRSQQGNYQVQNSQGTSSSFGTGSEYENSTELNKQGVKDFMEYENQVRDFINYYINDDLNCELINPGALTFEDTDEEGLLRLEEVADLIVRNNELGYEVNVKLNAFYAKKYENVVMIQDKADFFFKEMEPRNERQKRQWEENRKKHFEGSFRHFLISMASDKPAVLFGYKFYSGNFVENVSGLGYSNRTVGDNEIFKKDFVKKNNNNRSNYFEYDGQIRVEYTRAGNTDPDNIMGLGDFLNRTSWISLDDDEDLIFSDNGTILNPEAIEISGYWSYVPVCKMLPDDYLPKANKDNS